MPTTAAKANPDAQARREVWLGFDDGFKNNKIAGPNGILYTTPTRVCRGTRGVVALAGDQANIGEFRIGATTYTAGQVEGVSTSFDQYPFSELSRVMAHHALYEAGYGGARIHVATGLPLRLYYQPGSGQVNDKHIADKKSNLLAPIELVGASPSYGEDSAPFEIVQHEVTPEGLMAYFHLLIAEHGDGNVRYNKDAAGKPMGFVDMGGRTTDLAVVSGGQVDLARSRSIDHGVLNVRQHLREAICRKYGLQSLSEAQVDAALTRKQVHVYGEPRDVADLVRAAKETELGIIRDQVHSIFGEGAELSQVLLFGGACVDFADLLNAQRWYPHQQIAEDPLYVNALGMYKYLRFIA